MITAHWTNQLKKIKFNYSYVNQFHIGLQPNCIEKPHRSGMQYERNQFTHVMSVTNAETIAIHTWQQQQQTRDHKEEKKHSLRFFVELFSTNNTEKGRYGRKKRAKKHTLKQNNEAAGRCVRAFDGRHSGESVDQSNLPTYYIVCRPVEHIADVRLRSRGVVDNIKEWIQI